MPLLSLIIPAWNEAERLPALLDSVDAALACAREQGIAANAIEVIVANNASSDATAAIALARGCRVATVEKRAIAAARNGGARLASGELVAFVDADSHLHAQSFVAALAAMQDPACLGGATGVTMERWSLGIACTYALMLPMVWLTNFDTGMVFCRREDFEALEGYDESRLVAEDVDFLWRLRRLGRLSGRRLCRLPGVKAVTSTRKFDRWGDWHYFTRMPRLLWQLLHDRSALNEFARRYWYGDR